MSVNKPLWGIDLGGTKLEGIVIRSIADARPLARFRLDTEAAGGYQHIIERIRQLVTELETLSGIRVNKIGFGTPGILDPVQQTMKNCNTTALNGRPLKSDLEKALGVPVLLANDANCFALAETHWGAGKEQAANMVFGIIMGTGVGGGIVINGKIWNGLHGIAGEWGHNFLDDSGGPCYCGKNGCVETILSGPALERFYFSLTGTRAALKEIVVNSAGQQDEAAAQTINRLCHFFGKAVSVVCNVIDPDLIVVGGGVGNIEAIYTEGKSSLRHFIFNDRADTPIVKPVLGDSAGVFGAAALVS